MKLKIFTVIVTVAMLAACGSRGDVNDDYGMPPVDEKRIIEIEIDKSIPMYLDKIADALIDEFGQPEFLDVWNGGYYYMFGSSEIFFIYPAELSDGTDIPTAIYLDTQTLFNTNESIGLNQLNGYFNQNSELSFNSHDQDWFVQYEHDGFSYVFSFGPSSDADESIGVFVQKI